MFTLFRDINFDGKTVIPFTTHEGEAMSSGHCDSKAENKSLASCVSDVKRAFPKATVTAGFSIYGHEVQADRDRSGANGTSSTGCAKVEKWIKSVTK